MTRAVSLSRPARNLVFVRDRYRKRHEVYGDYESQALKADAPEWARRLEERFHGSGNK
jgi:hypothetical protein